MGDTLHSLAQGEIRGPLDPYIEVLVSDKFATENHFADKSLDNIGRILEDTKANIEISSSRNQDYSHRESFERCMVAYCQLLSGKGAGL